ncbi:MAG TPA: Rho termination factor N-terminal domain-containing protein [Dongiaceae bacterium]|nr:Rho termination factor N-terminal domain-containing protein [Dongiaceae bacterium]
MKLEEIKEIAKQHGIKAGKLKKAELVRAIQSAERNDPCFETGHVSDCGQAGCLWRPDCT